MTVVSMSFREYYGAPFRNDLAAILPSRPSEHVGFEDGTIQPRNLSAENSIVESWPRRRRDLFANALFFTILVDQVCYTHFGDHYFRFRELTQYPKLRGDCPGGCRYHVHPRAIFRALGSSPGRWHSPTRLLPEAVEVMYSEVLSFFRDYVPDVDGQEFWRRCEQELPQPTIRSRRIDHF